MVLILDLGGNQALSLARRVRGSGVYCEIRPVDCPLEEIAQAGARGILMAGEAKEEAPFCDAGLWNMNLPVLAMGESARRMAAQLGGRVMGEVLSQKPLELTLEKSPLFGEMDACERFIQRLDALEIPEGFQVIAQGGGMIAAFAQEEKKLYGMQFEVESNDPDGLTMLDHFLCDVCGCEKWWSMEAFVERTIEEIRGRVGAGHALMAISGGVDSSVCAALMHRAIGSQLHCIYVDTGLMRKGDREMVTRTFIDEMGINLTVVDAGDRFVARLAGVTDPREKWRVVQDEFARIYDEEAARLESVDFLVEGTIYQDVLKGSAPQGEAGAPRIEPVRSLFKDEVRAVGELLSLPEEIVSRQPFPGAGLGIRVIGEATREKLEMLREADAIWCDEIVQAGLGRKVRHYFAVLSAASAGEEHAALVVALRALGAAGSGYTAYRMPYDLLERATDRILAALPGVDRVVYDMTAVPLRTVEWE